MTGSYDDADGWPIDIILHAADGRLSYVERYRTDAGRLQNTGIPKPSVVRLSPSKDQCSHRKAEAQRFFGGTDDDLANVPES